MSEQMKCVRKCCYCCRTYDTTTSQ